MIKLLLLAVAALIPTMAFAEQQTGPIDYKSQDTVLEGYIAYNKSLEGKRPGIVLVPDWMGVAEHYDKIADKLADLGYVALVTDVYGKGVRPKNAEEAAALATKYRSDRGLMRQRVLAALDEAEEKSNG